MVKGFGEQGVGRDSYQVDMVVEKKGNELTPPWEKWVGWEREIERELANGHGMEKGKSVDTDERSGKVNRWLIWGLGLLEK